MADMDLLAFINHLAGAAVAMEAEKHRLLTRAAKIVETEAKHAIGHDNYDAGMFGPWPDLAWATMHGGVSPEGHRYPGKIELGFTGHVSPDDSLLRTGEMRASIGHVVGDSEAVVGSNEEKAVWQELGTSRGIPPRPFLAGAASRKAEQVARLLGEGTMRALLAGKAGAAID